MTISSTERDIFGNDTTDAVDVSDEALQWEADDSFADMEDESLPSDDEDPNANTNDDVELVDGDDDEDPSEDNDEDEVASADDSDLPEAFRGKTPAELVKIITDSQSHIGTQANELGQLRQMVEAIQQAQNQQDAGSAVPASEYIHDAADGLDAYRQGIGLLDEGKIGPEAIDEIIDVMWDIDPAVARKMDRDFGMRLGRAETNVQMAPVMQQSYELALQQATMQVNADPDAEAYREDIVRIVRQPKSLMEQQVAVAYSQARTAPDIAACLQAAIQVARGDDPTKSASYKALLHKAKTDEQSEGGNNLGGGQETMTEAERIIDGLINKKSPADALFAGFGAG